MRNNKYYANQIYGKSYQVKDESSMVYIDTQTISYNELLIQLKFSGPTYSQNRISLNLIPTAYACDYDPSRSEEKITSISIISNQDFNDKYPAGSDLTNLFGVSRTNNYLNKFSIQEYLNTYPTMEDVDFFLKEPTDVSKAISFSIIIHFDGKYTKELGYATPVINLLPG